MLCMLAATVLGATVGACLWHLRSASRFRRALGDVRRRAEAERRRLEAAFGEERERAAARHAEVLATLARTHDQAERARARQLAEIVNSGIQPIQNLRVMRHLQDAHGLDKPATAQWSAYWIRTGFEALEAMVSRIGGEYCVGDAVSLADGL